MPRKTVPLRARHPGLRPADSITGVGRLLVVVDDGPLKHAAWAEFHTVRKRQEKAARELHRHEEIDVPAYNEWLHHTFPTLITRLRELHEEVFAKGQQVQAVESLAYMTGRSPGKIWREQKAFEANPERARREDAGSGGDRRKDPWEREPFFGDEDGFDDDSGFPGGSPPPWEEIGSPKSRSAPPPSTAARDVYRRLVQRLHPDRGGAWTPARQRLWHQVQEAWATGDVDWLMRLEIEWEAAHDVLSPESPLGRLRAAIDELHAARRDIERKLRRYRGNPEWRFTLAGNKRAWLQRRIELNFHHDITFLTRQLDHLNALIASWEKTSRPRRRKPARGIEVRFCE